MNLDDVANRLLSPKMCEARVDHQATRVECREVIRETVSEFM